MTRVIILLVAACANCLTAPTQTVQRPDAPSVQATPPPQPRSVEDNLRAKLRANPDSVDSLVQLAELLGRSGLHTAAIQYWQRAAVVRPSSSAIHLSLALELMEAGRNDEAITELRALVEREPKSLDAQINLGAALSRIERFGDAIAAYQAALAIDPDNSVALLSLVKANVTQRSYSEAVPYIERYRQLKPEEFEGCYLAGLIDHQLKDEVNAVKELQHAVQLNAADYDAQWNLGSRLLATGQTDQAIEHLRRATQIKPSGPEAHFLLIRAYRLTGNSAGVDAEQKAIQEVERSDTRGAALDADGSRALAKGDAAQAIANYRSATELSPGDAKPYYDLALAYALAGERGEERKALLKAEQLDPDFSDAQNQLGFLDLENGHRDAAEKHFLSALRSKPQNVAALSNLGVLYAQTGRLKEAEHLMRLAAESSPAQPDKQRNLALILAANGKNREAIEVIDGALRIEPENGELWLTLGSLQQQVGETVPANASFKSAVKYAPASQPARVALASSCLAVSDVSCSLEEANEAVRLGPNSGTAHMRKAEALCALHRNESAEEEWKTALRLDSSLGAAAQPGCVSR